jgi:host factor-I protein
VAESQIACCESQENIKMARQALNLQDNFLNQTRRDETKLLIVLLDGSQIEGSVKGFDNFTVVVKSDKGTEHLIYKHAIAQLVSPHEIITGRPMGGGNKGGRGGRPHDGKRQHGGKPGGGDKRSEKSPEAGGEEQKGDGFNKLDFSKVELENKEAS